MKLFLLGLLILVCGYFLYGKIIEKIFGPDDREVPAKKNFAAKKPVSGSLAAAGSAKRT